MINLHTIPTEVIPIPEIAWDIATALHRWDRGYHQFQYIVSRNVVRVCDLNGNWSDLANLNPSPYREHDGWVPCPIIPLPELRQNISWERIP